MSQLLIVLTAGGTGGHLFPAEALANALRGMGARIVLATDKRVGALSASFPADEVIEIPSATPSGRSIPNRVKAVVHLGAGVATAVPALRRLKPATIVGFGGYPTVPPVIAGAMLGIPTIIHEQNGVMGRANRLLARWASRIATGFPAVKGLPSNTAGRTVYTGNPVRPAVIAAAGRSYPTVDPAGPMHLLVFGGSQGARVMSDIVPGAIERLPSHLRSRLAIVQQARQEDLDRVRDQYARLEVQADVQPFFKDLPQRIADAHLIVARSGASTVAELAVIGRPSILVPLPGALDQDQAANATSLATIGAATVVMQDQFTPERLAKEIQSRFENPDSLTRAASAAKSAGVTDAAERLAQAVLQLASSRNNGRTQ
jgi:UDP-N-acetylglucosamine--N-acetylmuramyl-(pentapeptide) pyrophosphoryl-undecaprenol N-acetylglucosamine transferase